MLGGRKNYDCILHEGLLTFLLYHYYRVGDPTRR